MRLAASIRTSKYVLVTYLRFMVNIPDSIYDKHGFLIYSISYVNRAQTTFHPQTVGSEDGDEWRLTESCKWEINDLFGYFSPARRERERSVRAWQNHGAVEIDVVEFRVKNGCAIVIITWIKIQQKYANQDEMLRKFDTTFYFDRNYWHNIKLISLYRNKLTRRKKWGEWKDENETRVSKLKRVKGKNTFEMHKVYESIVETCAGFPAHYRV